MRRPGGQTQYSAGLGFQAAATPRLRRLIAEIAAEPIGDLSLPRMAERAGFGSLDGLHRAFQKRLGARPGDYRERFGQG